KGQSTAMVGTPAANGVPEQSGAAATRPHQATARDAVVVVGLPPGAAAPETLTVRASGAGQRDIHVATNLRALVAATSLATSQPDLLAKERRDLNEVVHGVLIIGL